MTPTSAAPIRSLVPEPFAAVDAPTLEAFAAEWLWRVGPSLKERTRNTYAYTLRHYVPPEIMQLWVGQITRRTIRGVLNVLAERGLGPAVQRQVQCVLSAIFTDAMEHEFVERNPAEKMRIRGGTRPARVVYSHAEVATLLRAADATARPCADVYRACAWAGLRPGEAVTLRAPDLDARRDLLTIARTCLPNGATNPPKGGVVETIDIPRKLTRVLAKRAEAGGWLFPGIRGFMAYTTAQDAMQDVVRAAGLRPAGMHSLRHYYISSLVAAGADLEYVKRQARHASIALTSNVYARHRRPPRSPLLDRIF